MKNDKMYYYNTNIHIKLGDIITYRKFFCWKKNIGKVVYVPGQSPVNRNMEYGAVKLWAFSLNKDPHTVLSAGYFPQEEKRTLGHP